MILYHGTSMSALTCISDEGVLRPGVRCNWPDAPSRSDMIYLTNCYAPHFAIAAASEYDRPVVLEIEVSRDTLEQKGFPDEDFLYQARGPAQRDITHDDCRELVFSNKNLASLSLERLGTIALRGTIPHTSIRRVAVITRPVPWALMFDPTISIMNHTILGKFYENSLRLLFGDIDTMPRPSGLKPEITRDAFAPEVWTYRPEVFEEMTR